MINEPLKVNKRESTHTLEGDNARNMESLNRNDQLSLEDSLNYLQRPKSPTETLAIIEKTPILGFIENCQNLSIDEISKIIKIGALFNEQSYRGEKLFKRKLFNQLDWEQIEEKHPDFIFSRELSSFFIHKNVIDYAKNNSEKMESVFLDILEKIYTEQDRLITEEEISLFQAYIKEKNPGEEESIAKMKEIKSVRKEKQEKKKDYLFFDTLIANTDTTTEKYCLEILSLMGTRKSVDFFVDYVINNVASEKSSSYRFGIVKLLEKIDPQYAGEKILSAIATIGEYGRSLMVIIATDLLSSEEVRKYLDEKIDSEEISTDVIQKYESARALITPSQDKIAITNLQKFYQENIKFEEYEVNKKMKASEVSLLRSLIRKDEKILEMGCGTGRLLLAMHEDGYDISGLDFTQRHVDVVKKQNPEVTVSKEDWHNTNFPDESFETVYSLGRNILHDYSLPEQIRLFREANRILKSDGKFIFDIPNRNKGVYKKMVGGYAEEMRIRGIKNFRQGTIYDSPDGQHFATRYAFSHEDIEMIAKMTDFEISLVKKEPLETGVDDENIYYVLQKK